MRRWPPGRRETARQERESGALDSVQCGVGGGDGSDDGRRGVCVWGG